MGVHLGEVEAYPAPGAAHGTRYLGLPLVRCGRLHGHRPRGADGALRGGDRAGAGRPARRAPPCATWAPTGSRTCRRPERVSQLLHPDLPADFPPLRSLDALPHNLPRQLTSFVGRERELAGSPACWPARPS